MNQKDSSTNTLVCTVQHSAIQLTLPTFEYLHDETPLIDRLYQWLINRCSEFGGSFVGSNRLAADALGCSASIICEYMKRLAADGRIERTPLSRGHRITVIFRGLIDTAAQFITPDRSPQEGDRSGAYIDRNAHTHARSISPKDQEEENTPASEEAPEAVATAISEPEIAQLKNVGVFATVLPDIIAKIATGWSVRDFLDDLQIAKERGKSIGYVINAWRRGNRLRMPETQDGRQLSPNQLKRPEHTQTYSSRPYGGKVRANRATGEIYGLKRSWSCDTPNY